MKKKTRNDTEEALKTISADRQRSNLLRKPEQRVLAWFVQRVPAKVTSNMFTFLGFLGSLIVLAAFIMAAFIDRTWLLLGIAGLMINWFGDSLDGRLAIYRHKSRKWWGFSLDLSVDWISTVLIGMGYVIYSDGIWEIVGYLFVAMYAWAMINTLMRYRITSQYTIDTGLLGPTEARLIIAAILITEVLVKDSIHAFLTSAALLLLAVNIYQLVNLLKVADERDKMEKENNKT